MKHLKTYLLVLLVPLSLFGKTKKNMRNFLGGGLIGTASNLLVELVTHYNNKYDNYNNEYNFRSFSNDVKNININNDLDKKVYFDDVIGIDDAKEEVKTVVEFLQNPEKFKRLGAKIPKGILLEGPPGNGKTLLARAIANETNCNFYYESGSAFVEMYVGVGAKRLRDIFEKARKNQPALIFIDEVDAIGAISRGSGANEEYRQTLNEFLCQLDGFNKDESVIVIGATNNAYALDKALLRPGRFTKIVNIPSLNEKSRKDILNFYINKLPSVDCSNIYLDELAKKTTTFSGADLENLVNEATLNAVKNNKNKVDQSDLGVALQKTLNRPY